MYGDSCLRYHKGIGQNKVNTVVWKVLHTCKAIIIDKLALALIFKLKFLISCFMLFSFVV